MDMETRSEAAARPVAVCGRRLVWALAPLLLARIEDRQLLITGQTPGETYVFVDATVEGNPNTAQFAYHVITIEPT